MAQIELFSYKKGYSKLHRAHPTLKIVLLFVVSFSITYGNGYQLFFYLGLILVGFYTARLNSLFSKLKYILFLAITLILFQVILVGDLTKSTWVSNLIYLAKMTEIILIGTLFSATTRPEDITPGLYNIIRNKKIAENISLTIRLVPTFLISWRSIEESLDARGLYLKKRLIYILKNISIPMLVETFKKADSISEAMESRCYDGWVEQKSTESKIDVILIILVILPHLPRIKMLLLQG